MWLCFFFGGEGGGGLQGLVGPVYRDPRVTSDGYSSI